MRAAVRLSAAELLHGLVEQQCCLLAIREQNLLLQTVSTDGYYIFTVSEMLSAFFSPDGSSSESFLWR